jgi:DnaJ-class molecular chaperone
MNKLSRRAFFIIASIPFLVAKAVASAAAISHHTGMSLPPSAEDGSAVEGYATSSECSACRGLGAITCPACDGTGMWTEASESAGLHQREAARASGHCAWCNDRGEAVCMDCSGIGFTIWDSQKSIDPTNGHQRGEHDTKCRRAFQNVEI